MLGFMVHTQTTRTFTGRNKILQQPAQSLNPSIWSKIQRIYLLYDLVGPERLKFVSEFGEKYDDDTIH